MKSVIRKDEAAVSPVIATILMVAITVVLAAVLYVMVSGLLVGPGASKPVLQFVQTVPVASGVATVTIASVSQDAARDSYRVNLKVGATLGAAAGLLASGTATPITVGAASYSITWADLNGEGKVTGGDWFTVTTTGGLPAASTFTFFLSWNDGSLIQQITWTTA